MQYDILILFLFTTFFYFINGQCHIQDITSCLVEVKKDNIPLNETILDVITNVTTEAKLIRLCRVYQKTRGCFEDKIYQCASQEQVSFLEKIDRYYKLLCSKTSLPFQKMLYKYGKCLKYAMDNFNEDSCNVTSSTNVKIKKCEENCDEDNNECQTKIEDSKIRLCEHDFVTEQCGSQASQFFDVLKSTEYDDEYPINCMYKNATARGSYKEIVNKKKTKTNKIINQRISNNIHEIFKSLKTSKPEYNLNTTTEKITTINPILTMNPYHGAYVPFEDSSPDYQETTTAVTTKFSTTPSMLSSTTKILSTHSIPSSTTKISSTQSILSTKTSITFPQFTTSPPETKLIFPNFVNQQVYSPPETTNTPSLNPQLTINQTNPFNFTFKFNPNYTSPLPKDTPPKTTYLLNIKENNDLKQFKDTANTYVSTALDVIADKTQDLVKNAVVREVFATILRLSPEILNQTDC